MPIFKSLVSSHILRGFNSVSAITTRGYFLRRRRFARLSGGRGGVLGAALLAISSVIVSGCAVARESASSYEPHMIDLAAGDWLASNGAVRNAPDPAKQKQGPVLGWHYTPGSQPTFLARRQLVGQLSGADTLSFSIKSDREGTLMLRLGTTGGKNYLSSFRAATGWTEVNLRLDEFLAENGGGKLSPAAVDTLLLADLSGQGRQSSGDRTVWLTELRMSAAGPGNANAAGAAAPLNYAGSWTASAGTIRLGGDPLRQIAANVVEWNYEIGSTPVFIADRGLAGRFPAASAGIAFRARSDRAGLLFIRLVTSSGSYVVNFTATPSWQSYTFGFDQFVAERNVTGRPQAGRIQGIAVADLNGEKRVLSGRRTVWLSKIGAIDQDRKPLQ